MKIWDVSIRNPVFITMVMLALVVVGVLAYLNMPLDFFPDVSFPTMAVITVYPGAGPGEVEDQLTRPIEEAMVTAPGVEEVQSRSSENYSMVIVSFNLDKDPEAGGVLQGIKGQYLIFDTGVINLRKFTGYAVEVYGAPA